MKKKILSLALVGLIGCSVPQLAALSKDETLALSFAKQLHVLLTTGATLDEVKSVSSSLLSTDPSSPTLQRLNATVQSAQTATDLQAADLADQGLIILLETGQAITQAATPSAPPTAKAKK
jgi:hypothetical protein